MKKIYIPLTFSVALLLASCGSKNNETTSDEAAVAVKVNQVTENQTTPLLSVSGKIQSTNSADLSTRMMGYVNKVYVNVGDSVKKGQMLISINSADLMAQKAQVDAAISQATVAFNNAEKDYKRFQNLFADNSASQKEMDDMTAHYEIAKAQLEAAKQKKNEVNAQLAYTNITAPFSGTITNKYIEAGDMANPGMPLISIEVPNDYEVIAMVPETEISQIEKGTPVDVLVKSINKAVKGKVEEVSTSAKNTGGQYLVKIALDKTDAPILSGMFTTVQFPVTRTSDSQMVVVPADAIIHDGQLTGIYTVSQSNTAILRWLRLGRTMGDQVEVLSGLSADETYIVSADGKLYNGVKIKY
ncbi:efflux RND transporter periplasmic adaptor subunit [Gaetbulibacter aestuarii]|uniref:Efflux RND transporter periplasmic adaptor subunit n=1 Tax=Gaetbulibacter aestuarii TaxID=1502358 RepID=A0ABW7MY63_9FLAO